jgi:hypothetical protein
MVVKAGTAATTASIFRTPEVVVVVLMMVGAALVRPPHSHQAMAEGWWGMEGAAVAVATAPLIAETPVPFTAIPAYVNTA